MEYRSAWINRAHLQSSFRNIMIRVGRLPRYYLSELPRLRIPQEIIIEHRSFIAR